MRLCVFNVNASKIFVKCNSEIPGLNFISSHLDCDVCYLGQFHHKYDLNASLILFHFFFAFSRRLRNTVGVVDSRNAQVKRFIVKTSSYIDLCAS